MMAGRWCGLHVCGACLAMAAAVATSAYVSCTVPLSDLAAFLVAWMLSIAGACRADALQLQHVHASRQLVGGGYWLGLAVD